MPTNWLGWLIGGFLFGIGFNASGAVFHAVIDQLKTGKDKGKP